MRMMRTDDSRLHDMQKDVRNLTLKIKEVNSNFYIMYQYSGEQLTGNIIVYASKESLDYFYQIFDDSFTFYVESIEGMTRTELRKVHEIVTEFIGCGQDE